MYSPSQHSGNVTTAPVSHQQRLTFDRQPPRAFDSGLHHSNSFDSSNSAHRSYNASEGRAHYVDSRSGSTGGAEAHQRETYPQNHPRGLDSAPARQRPGYAPHPEARLPQGGNYRSDSSNKELRPASSLDSVRASPEASPIAQTDRTSMSAGHKLQLEELRSKYTALLETNREEVRLRTRVEMQKQDLEIEVQRLQSQIDQLKGWPSRKKPVPTRDTSDEDEVVEKRPSMLTSFWSLFGLSSTADGTSRESTRKRRRLSVD